VKTHFGKTSFENYVDWKTTKGKSSKVIWFMEKWIWLAYASFWHLLKLINISEKLIGFNLTSRSTMEFVEATLLNKMLKLEQLGKFNFLITYAIYASKLLKYCY
jgi:hypothetical protein